MWSPSDRLEWRSAIFRRALLVRWLRRTLRLRVHAIHHFLNRALQLHAVPFGEPLPFGVEHAERRHGDAAAVGEFRRAADADEPVPGARADQRSEAGFAEIKRKRVAGIASDR